MRTMGIDQSYTSTGCVIMDDDEIIHVEAIRSEKTQLTFDRAWDISYQLCKLRKHFNIAQVRLEGLAFGNVMGNSSRDLAGLQFMIYNMLIHAHQKPPQIDIISPTTLKKFATGSGKAKKIDMMLSLPDDVVFRFEHWEFYRKMTKRGTQHTYGYCDIADAYWLCTFVIC